MTHTALHIRNILGPVVSYWAIRRMAVANGGVEKGDIITFDDDSMLTLAGPREQTALTAIAPPPDLFQAVPVPSMALD